MNCKVCADGVPDGIRMLLRFEQRNLWNLERMRARMSDGTFDSRYLPENGLVFRLPCFWILRKHFYVYGNSKSDDAVPIRQGNGDPNERVLFPVHPAELRRYANLLNEVQAKDVEREGLRLIATPTSSTRTLLVWQEKQPCMVFFAKLSLESRVLGDRRLSRRKVATSIGLSTLVAQSGHSLPDGMKYFPETLGLVPRRMQDHGVLFRSVPGEIREDRVMLAPLFALIGGSPGQTPLLLHWMESCAMSAGELLEEALLEKFAETWVELVFEFGLILEAHGQDLLLMLSSDLKPKGGLYYRDFEGLAVDWVLRRVKGLPEPAQLPNSCEWFATYETWGYPLYQLISTKLRASLFDYLHLVLGDIEAALLDWQESGLTRRQIVRQGDLSFLFSRHLRRVIRQRYGISEGEEYDIRQQLNRFVKFLMSVRREIIGHRA